MDNSIQFSSKSVFKSFLIKSWGREAGVEHQSLGKMYQWMPASGTYLPT